MSAADRLVTWTLALGRQLWRLAPNAKQPAWDAELAPMLRDRCAAVQPRSLPPVLAISALELADIAITAARLRLALSSPTGAMVRRGRRLTAFDALMMNLRHAWRRSTAHPGSTLAAASMLGAGIGITTAMFAVTDALLLRPAPFKNSDRLGQVCLWDAHGGPNWVTPAVMEAWRGSGAFAAVEGFTNGTALISTSDGPVAQASAFTSPNLLRLLDARPLAGRLFTADEAGGDRPEVAVVGERLWRSLYRADRGLVGRRITVDDHPVTVVGILSDTFHFPRWQTEIWMPAAYEPGSAHRASALVRVADGRPLRDALQTATDVAHRVDPASGSRWAQRLPLGGGTTEYYGRALRMLTGAVVLVWLVLSCNASSVLLVRFSARRREYGVCAALGAGTGRLLAESLAESVIVAALGSAIGLTIAWWLGGASAAWLPAALLDHTLNPIDLDGRALWVAAGAGALSTMLAGALPAWIATRSATASSGSGLAGSRGGSERKSMRRLTRALLVGEIALGCALLLGSALLVRSFVKLSQIDLGLNPRGVLIASAFIDAAQVPDPVAREALEEAIVARVGELPGVSRVMMGAAPTSASGLYFNHWRSDGLKDPVLAYAEGYAVPPEFFDFYAVRLISGRIFDIAEDPDHAIVSERFASVLWPGINPLGHTFRLGQGVETVVGVTREMRRPSADWFLDLPEFYLPRQRGGSSGALSIRCAGACPPEGRIRSAIAPPGDRRIAVPNLVDLNDVYAEDLAQPRASAALGMLFAGISLLAGGAGLFAVLSYSVSRRMRELGIRSALGATPRALGRAVAREGAAIGAAGLTLGAAAALMVARILRSVSYGVTAGDPLSWAVVILGLAAVIALSTWRPARRAMSADPLALLRED